VGEYRVIGVAGSGAAGEVYKVEHTITRRVEAMKVLLRERAGDPSHAARFLREIQLQASLVHPNIATVLNASRARGHLVMVMELVEGRTLEQALAQGRLPLRTGAGYILQALAALEYAHERGVTHRDLKPSNMLLTPDGVLKLTDFGLARTLDDPRLTQSGAVVGSLHYISPEQIRSDPDVDLRTDIYSLGAVLYEVVTGGKPFPLDNSFALMRAHLETEPEPPHVRTPGIPVEISQVVLRAMAKRREDRYASAREFREALAQALENRAPASAPTAARRPAPLGWLAAAAALAGFGGVVGARAVWDAMHRPVATLALRFPAPPPVPPTAEREGPPREVTSVVVSAAVPRRNRPAVPAFAADSTAPLPVPASAPRHALAEMPPPAEPKPSEAPVKPEPVPPAFPAGRLHPIGMLPPGVQPSVVALSPDGRWLAVGGGQGVVELWQVRPPRRLRPLAGHSAAVASLAFSADSASLVSGGADGAVKVWNLKEGIEAKTFGQPAPVRSVAISPDAGWVAFGTADRRVRLWSLREKGVVTELRDVRREPVALAFHPAGGWLAMAAADKTTRIWRLTPDPAQIRGPGLDRGARNVLFSPDGQYLAVAGDDQVRILDARNGSPLHLTNPPSRVVAVSFVEDSRCVAVLQTAEGVRVWDVWQGEMLPSPLRQRGVAAAAFRPDGRELALIGEGAGIALWSGLPPPAAPRLRLRAAP
jgi:hypothetical protein